MLARIGRRPVLADRWCGASPGVHGPAEASARGEPRAVLSVIGEQGGDLGGRGVSISSSPASPSFARYDEATVACQ